MLPYYQTCIYMYTLPLTHSPTHSLSHSLSHSLTHTLSHSLTLPLTHSPTHSHTHPLTHSLTLSLPHSLTHSLTHTLTNPSSMIIPFIAVEKQNLKDGKFKEKETKIDTKIQGGNTKGKGVDPYKDIDQRFMESNSKNVLQDSKSSDLYALLTDDSLKNSRGGDDQEVSEGSFNTKNILLGFDDRPKKNPKIPENKKAMK
jgi:hypothetical protein